jgi:hypothetical protein
MGVLDLDSYLCRRKVMALTGKIHVTDPSGSLVAFSKQKALKLREDIRVYPDESETNPILLIKARSIIDLGATYDVTGADGAPLGALRRKAMKSILKDHWVVLGPGDGEVGTIEEDSTGLALVRRFVPLMNFLLTQSYGVTIGGSPLATFKRNMNPFVSKLEARITGGTGEAGERMLLLAAAVLLLLIEGKQG